MFLLTGPDGRVSSDGDFVFYNQPEAAQGAARLLGKSAEGAYSVERAALHLAALPPHLHRVIVAIGVDGPVDDAGLQLHSAAGSWAVPVPTDSGAGAVVIAEFYRSVVNGHRPIWSLRSVGQSWPGGLAVLAQAHGVVLA